MSHVLEGADTLSTHGAMRVRSFAIAAGTPRWKFREDAAAAGMRAATAATEAEAAEATAAAATTARAAPTTTSAALETQ